MTRYTLPGLVALTFLLPFAAAQNNKEPAKLTPDSFKDITLRCIGPTLSSGRIGDIVIDPKNKSTWYVAVASGGVWKTTNRGLTWTPIFDNEVSYSIGCITLDPKNPDVVWVGTGENLSQRSCGFGDGVYKSLDGGKTWKNMGLTTSEHIAKIVIDPRDSDTVYVASQGPLWSPGGERGLFKTTDGGKTWKAVLQIGAHTGVTDVVIDSKNPDTLIAAAYQRRRNNGVLIGGGPEGGIHKTEDGGKTWKKLTNGLPKGDLGRIALGISPMKPEVVYAQVTAGGKEGGFYRSEDSGETWVLKNAGSRMSDSQYYGEMFVDPVKFDKVYTMDLNVGISEDGGKTFQAARWPIHVDNHALAFDPDDATHFLVGNDGGLYETYDGGKTFRHFNTMPITQFYRVGLDNSKPFYKVYGGTQDNGSQGGPARTGNRVGIRSSDWEMMAGADGFQSRVDPTDPNTVYTMSQNGGLQRIDRKTGNATGIRPGGGRMGGGGGGGRTRWHWDSPFIISPHNPKRLYFAGNILYRSDNRGDTWTAVSPDLTRQLDRAKIEIMGKTWGAGAITPHVNTTDLSVCSALSESPVTEGLIYVGTDDGNVQITEDGGKTWRKIDKLPGAPEMSYVADVCASPHDANVAYLALNDWQMGIFTPLVYKTTDKGKTWKSVRGDFPDRQPVWCVLEDPVKKGLLFAGTEFGLFVSIDDGAHWTQLKGGVPPIPFRDLEIHPTEGDLVGATFGRGFYVLDDLTPFRQLSAEVLAGEGTVFRPRKATLASEQGFVRTSDSNTRHPNPPPGVIFTYYLPADLTDGKLVLNITDADGKKVRELTGPATAGFHRVNWDVSGTRRGFGGGGPGGGGGGGGAGGQPGGGPQVVKAGPYMVTLGKQGKDKTTPLGESRLFEILEAGNEP